MKDLIQEITAAAVEAAADFVHDITSGGPGSGRHCEVCNVNTKASLCPKCYDAVQHYRDQHGVNHADAIDDLKDQYQKYGEQALRKYSETFHGDLEQTLKHSLKADSGYPDTGKYDYKREQHVRNELAGWVAYAESGPSFDPIGKYLCGTCHERLEPDSCMWVTGKIDMKRGSCRLYSHGVKQQATDKAPYQLTQIEAQYSELKK